MTWSNEPVIDLSVHDDRIQATLLQVEVACMFASFDYGSLWERCEVYWSTYREHFLARKRSLAELNAARTGITATERDRFRRHSYRTIVVASATCSVCGAEFDVNKDRGMRGTFRTCSHECQVASMRGGRPTSSTRPGVCRHKRTNKWQAAANGRYIGSFDTEEDAARAVARETAEPGSVSRRRERASNALRQLLAERWGGDKTAMATATGIPRSTIAYIARGMLASPRTADVVERIISSGATRRKA